MSTFSAPPNGSERVRGLRVAGWMLWWDPHTPHWHPPGCSSGRKERRCSRHPQFQKEETDQLHPLISSLLSDRQNTHAWWPKLWRKDMLEPPTLSRIASEVGQEAPPSSHRADEKRKVEARHRETMPIFFRTRRSLNSGMARTWSPQ